MYPTHLDFANINFNCPYCDKQYKDDKDKYLDRCNKNKNGITRISCSCGHKFYMTYNYKSNAVSFKLNRAMKEEDKLLMQVLAKEKAEDLVARGKMILMSEDTDCGCEILCTMISIKFAHTTADEMIKIPMLSDFWKLVKVELNKL